LVEVFHELARQKESKIIEGHLQPDHIHMLISIPPKYSVAQVIGYMKGKSAIHIARTYLGQRKNFSGMSFWARGTTLLRQLEQMRKL
jgi:putative transposase